MANNVRKILITEEIPSKNKGEAAILIGILKSISLSGLKNIEVGMLCVDKKNNDFDSRGVKLFSYVKDIDQKSKLWAVILGVRFTLKITLYFFIYWILSLANREISSNDEVVKSFLEADILVCGHDGIIEGLENKSNKFNKFVTYLYIFYHIILIKVFLKKKVCVIGASIGPFRNGFIEKLARRSLALVDLITVRDPKTYKYLKNIGLQNHIYLTADFAYLMEPEKIDIPEVSRNENFLIGFTVSTGFHLYIDSGSEDEESKYIKYIKMKARLLDALVDKYDARILFVPHAIKRGKDDRVVAKDVIKEMNSGERVIFLQDDFSPEELKYIISKCNFFIGERTHSNIAATSMGVLGISFSEPGSHRNSMFVDLWGEKSVIEMDKMDVEMVNARVDEILTNRQKYKSELIKKTMKYRKDAERNGILLQRLLDE